MAKKTFFTVVQEARGLRRLFHVQRASTKELQSSWPTLQAATQAARDLDVAARQQLITARYYRRYLPESKDFKSV